MRSGKIVIPWETSQLGYGFLKAYARLNKGIFLTLTVARMQALAQTVILFPEVLMTDGESLAAS